MAPSVRASVSRTVHDAVPFVVITVLWTVIMLLVYGVFLVTKPARISYDPWVHATVFVVPGIAFVGHVLRQALHG